jgi:hypothetical protein
VAEFLLVVNFYVSQYLRSNGNVVLTQMKFVDQTQVEVLDSLMGCDLVNIYAKAER